MSTLGPSVIDTNREEKLLAEYLVEQVCGNASGRLRDECLYNSPRDVYFIGNLRPRPNDLEEVIDGPAYSRELLNKLSPVAFGADFRLTPHDNEIAVDVTVKWDCYYRIFPTLEQQIRHQKQLTAEEEGNESEEIKEAEAVTKDALATPLQSSRTVDGEDNTLVIEQEKEEALVEQESPEATETVKDRRRSRISTDSLFVHFRKIHCNGTGHITLRRVTSEKWVADRSELEAALNAETTRAQQVALADNARLRASGDLTSPISVPETALDSVDAYNTFLQSLTDSIVPEWGWDITADVYAVQTDNNEELVLQLAFINSSPEQAPPPREGSTRRRDNPNIEPFLFDTSASFKFKGAISEPFELELAPRGFRYNRDLLGRGFNCAVEQDEQIGVFSTTHTPIFRQKRYTTQDEPQARFSELASNPLPTLERIAAAMENYLPIWDAERNRYIENVPDWEVQFNTSFNADKQHFENEINNFRRGLELIRENTDVRLAFQLTNETFRRAGTQNLPNTKQKKAWRLFQVVFLVSQIPGMAALSTINSPDAAEREVVDIIYFPTGGGKTEAYLATLVFHCFFDRLRGKTAGVTAWTRFPLRLLTLQQTQRVADVIGVAELIRLEHNDPRLSGKKVEEFAVGYFVGKEATPNEILNPDRVQKPTAENRLFWSQANDPNERRKWKRVITCPACRTKTVQVDFDVDAIKIIHRCTNPNCSFQEGRIPVYVVDNEIYRYLPSVIVGTIDKLASLGNQRKLAQVFGLVDGTCERHGYYKGRCCQKDCEGRQLLRPRVPPGLSGPTLFIQDELHLLKEGLGTFDGHYETFTQQLRRHFGQTQPLKIIASSATIEEFERQAKHLYGRIRARVFPHLGPTQGESFYAHTQVYPQRLFIGLIPHNKTIFNTVLEMIELYHRTVQELQRLTVGSPNPYGGDVVPGTTQWHQFLDYYVTSLTYFLANRELDSIRTDIIGDVNPNLASSKLNEIVPLDMTGGTSTDDVTTILERLEQAKKINEPADAVLATSMISHGVDVDRLNSMFFYGMPRQTAEYIQASSRVGRSHVGVVFTCLHPARERDQSHYTYFAKYHEFIGQLVEPVAINRWAKFSVNRTLPGLFMGVLLQVLSNSSEAGTSGGRYYRLEYIKQKISDGSIKPEQFIPFLEEAYLVSSASTIAEVTFRDEIRRRVRSFLDFILTARSDVEWVSEALIPKPMMSLRDVDEAINIELDSSGTRWAELISRG